MRLPDQAAEGLRRASRGGMLTGAQLLAVASLLVGAARLARAVQSAAGQQGWADPEGVLAPAVSMVKVQPAAGV